MAWGDIVGGVGAIQSSPAESKKFGISIARLVIGQAWRDEFSSESKLHQYLQQICESDENDLIVIRVPSELLHVINTLKFRTRKLLFTGTLVYWEMETQEEKAPNLCSNFSISSAAEIDDEARNQIFEVLESSFKNYQNHYTANPALALSSAAGSYRDWASKILDQNPEDIILVSEGEQIAGIAVLSSPVGGPIEILLAGVAADFQRRGAYIALLAGVTSESHRRGCGKVVISTQVQNLAVQRAWSKFGFKPTLAIDTFHSMKVSPEATATARPTSGT